MRWTPLHYFEPFRGQAPDVVLDVVDGLMHLLNSLG